MLSIHRNWKKHCCVTIHKTLLAWALEIVRSLNTFSIHFKTHKSLVLRKGHNFLRGKKNTPLAKIVKGLHNKSTAFQWYTIHLQYDWSQIGVLLKYNNRQKRSFFYVSPYMACRKTMLYSHFYLSDLKFLPYTLFTKFMSQDNIEIVYENNWNVCNCLVQKDQKKHLKDFYFTSCLILDMYIDT